ncbi:hypothetical protein NLI96_g12821 [Meripilus lineatus]|uniref:Uncharacterized protein n=1 Tax=Meripilus lineatus TaxID=2056292 RepID=A0AAD5UTV4_9APHY|nr:hypothetical protein NLI96_g12821 [Physisporinus lineatus]
MNRIVIGETSSNITSDDEQNRLRNGESQATQPEVSQMLEEVADINNDEGHPPVVGRKRRCIRPPLRFRDPGMTYQGRVPLPKHHSDQLPEPLPPIPPPDPPTQRLPRIILIVRDTIRTAFNIFGLMREYPHRPSYDPDAEVHAAILARKGSTPHNSEMDGSLPDVQQTPPWPYTNMTSWLFMSWLTNGKSSKSQGEAARLIELMKHDEFKFDELKKINVAREFNRLDQAAADRSKLKASEGGDEWQETSVEIEVPTGTKDSGGQSGSSLHRSFGGVITSACKCLESAKYP